MKALFITFYFFLLFIICLYGVNLYWLIAIYLKNRKRMIIPAEGALGRDAFPTVTVQLPIYNEKRVAIRLIEAVSNLDWPNEKLEIQILDDSEDVTSELIESYLAQNNNNNADSRNITHIRRPDRTGFKAGALANGLSLSQAKFVAVFDADNLPRPDFLMSVIPFFNNDSIGMVQCRWSFLNRNESFLCRAQALFLDAHFHIEQQARFLGGLFFNFNGTAGIWRRRAIEEAGGWQFDTLTEDLDLSMRAQLKGWKFIYNNSYDVPTELPNNITGFKTQQYRWAKGAVQTAIKLLPAIFREVESTRVKIAALFHLGSKTLSVALLLLAILLVPALHIRMESGFIKLFLIDLPIFLAGSGSMSFFYGLAFRAERKRSSLSDIFTIPALTSLGIALAVNNSRAFFSAIMQRPTGFVRTPKSGSTDAKSRKIPIKYRQPLDSTIIAETILALYSMLALVQAFKLDLFLTLPFLATFFFGFLYFSTKGFCDNYAR